jgi:hypothetical protein
LTSRILRSDRKLGHNPDVETAKSLNAEPMTNASHDTLQDTLNELLRSGSTANPALNRLLDDYTTYHLVLVAIGVLFLIGFAGLSVFSWRAFRRAPKTGPKWTFEQRTHLSFATFGAVLSALMALVIAANLSSAMDPRPGFAGSLGQIRAAPPGTRTDSMHQAFTTWLRSSSTDTPKLVQRAIDDRLAWQQPKAIICTVLLAAFVWLSVHASRRLITRSRLPGSHGTRLFTTLRSLRWLSVAVCLLLTLMVLGNTQASAAPLCLTMFNG